MEKKTVCLTGATGHVGYAILKELQKHEDKEIRILIRRDSDIFDGLRCDKRKGGDSFFHFSSALIFPSRPIII